MSTIVCIENGVRYVAKPRDRRGVYPCLGCSLAFIPAAKRRCPCDRAGNLICRYGAGWIWRRIPKLRATKPLEIEADGPVQMRLMMD